MKVNKNKKNRPKIVSVVIVLAILLSVSVYALYTYTQGSSQPNSQQTEESQIDNKTDGADKSVEPGTNTTTDKIPINKTANAKIRSITQSDGYVNVAAEISNSSTGGKCSVVFENSNARPVSVIVDSTATDDLVSCNTVKISESEFSFIGTWNVTLRYYTNSEQVVAQGSVEIK